MRYERNSDEIRSASHNPVKRDFIHDIGFIPTKANFVALNE